jgi:DNA (cytosine-5)-methyltransferase 1
MRESLDAHSPTPKIAAVDLFCGAAGLSLGLKESGIRIAAGIDLDPACRFPFEENIGATFLEKDVGTLDPGFLRALYGDATIKVLAGCAPCQPFSGYTTKWRATDRRWELLLRFLRLTEIILPEVITVENVPRLVHLPLWKRFVTSLETAGYHIVWSILDAADYGVPQNRRRLVLLGSRLGPIGLPSSRATDRATVRSTIGKLPKIAAGVAGKSDLLHAARALTSRNLLRIRASRPAGTWREWPKHLRVACHQRTAGKTYPSVYGRMSWDDPAPTITTQFYGFGNGRFGHPDQDRAITLREGALLQSFPLDFKFVPLHGRVNFRLIGRLIGNAVPPALGRAIGDEIVSHITAQRLRR